MPKFTIPEAFEDALLPVAPDPREEPLPLHSLQEIEMQFYEHFFFQKNLEPYAIQEEAFNRIFKGEHVLVTVPTGTGKTMIAKAGLWKALHSHQTAIYTTPLRALTEEKYRELCQDFGGQHVGFATGDYKINPKAPIQVVVAEILWTYIFSQKRRRPADIVIMDEGHYFNDYERGYVWEQAIIGLDKQTQLVILSATIGNPEQFCQWAYITRGVALELVQSYERRVPLYHRYEEKYLVEIVRDLFHHGDTPAIIFCFSRPQSFEYARLLKSVRRFTSDEEQKEIQKKLSTILFPRGFGENLPSLLLHGIGIHHAGILPAYKRLVEELTLERLLKFVVSTETISAGINLPAKRVIFPALRKQVRKQRRLLLPAEYHQMAGRAGRPQFDTEGIAIALAPEDVVQEIRKELNDAKKGRFSKPPDEEQIRKRAYSRARTEAQRNQDVSWDGEAHQKIVEGLPAALKSHTKITAEQILAIGLPDLDKVVLPGLVILQEEKSLAPLPPPPSPDTDEDESSASSPPASGLSSNPLASTTTPVAAAFPTPSTTTPITAASSATPEAPVVPEATSALPPSAPPAKTESKAERKKPTFGGFGKLGQLSALLQTSSKPAEAVVPAEPVATAPKPPSSVTFERAAEVGTSEVPAATDATPVASQATDARSTDGAFVEGRETSLPLQPQPTTALVEGELLLTPQASVPPAAPMSVERKWLEEAMKMEKRKLADPARMAAKTEAKASPFVREIDLRDEGVPALDGGGKALDIREVIDNLLLDDQEKREAHKQLAMITANLRALGIVDEHGRQLKGKLIGELRGMDGLFVYYCLMKHDITYAQALELVEYLIDHDVIQKIINRKAEDEKKEWMRQRIRERRVNEPMVSWDDIEIEYNRLFPKPLTFIEIVHQSFVHSVPHPELHGGKLQKSIWALMEKEQVSFLGFVEKHQLDLEEGNFFTYLARVMKAARTLYEVTQIIDFRTIEERIREKLAVIDERVLSDAW